MIEQDTVKLLRECDAGVKMGVSSINDAIGHVSHSDLRDKLTTCRDAHESLGGEIQGLLDRYRDDGKDPNPIAKGMSWVKTNVMLAMDDSDKTIADLMTDGCNMGVKSLHRYINQYKAADEASRSIAGRLAGLEEKLVTDIRQYL